MVTGSPFLLDGDIALAVGIHKGRYARRRRRGGGGRGRVGGAGDGHGIARRVVAGFGEGHDRVKGQLVDGPGVGIGSRARAGPARGGEGQLLVLVNPVLLPGRGDLEAIGEIVQAGEGLGDLDGAGLADRVGDGGLVGTGIQLIRRGDNAPVGGPDLDRVVV